MLRMLEENRGTPLEGFSAPKQQGLEMEKTNSLALQPPSEHSSSVLALSLISHIS